MNHERAKVPSKHTSTPNRSSFIHNYHDPTTAPATAKIPRRQLPVVAFIVVVFFALPFPILLYLYDFTPSPASYRSVDIWNPPPSPLLVDAPLKAADDDDEVPPPPLLPRRELCSALPLVIL